LGWERIRAKGSRNTNVVASAEVDVVLVVSKLVVTSCTLFKLVLVVLVLEKLVKARLVLDVELTVFTELFEVLVEPRGSIFPSTMFWLPSVSDKNTTMSLIPARPEY
jgi:hypothetical protein